MLKQIKDRFEVKEFKNGQEGAILAALEKRDVLCFMPTGYGKSICYQIPAILGNGVTLIVTPLISLMNDQVHELKKKGFPSVAIHAESDRDHVRMMLSKSSTKLIYLSPERLLQKGFIEFISQRKIDRIVIDEAHCISMWGDGFRPEYQRIGEIVSHLQSVLQERIPVSAFTATANHRIINDIIRYSGMRKDSAYYFKGNVIRENIFLEMKRTGDKKDALVKYIYSNRFEPTVVYVNTIKDAESTSKKLSTCGINHKIFHSRLPLKQKTDALNSFISNDSDIMIATSAFGMGINKSNIRHVIHLQVPESVEMYYQQVGRAGRDGASSKAIMFFDNKDRSLNRFMTQLSYPKPESIWSAMHSIESLSYDGVVDAEESVILEKCPIKISAHELRGIVKLLVYKGVINDWSDKNEDFYRLELSGIGKKINVEDIAERRRRSFDDFDSLFEIADSILCRAFLIEDYFSSKDIDYKECGNCDNCKRNSLSSNSFSVSRDDISLIKKDTSLIQLFSKNEIILHWLGYRSLKRDSRTFALTQDKGYSYSVQLFGLLYSMGFFIGLDGAFIPNKVAFKNKSLVNTMTKIDYINADITNIAETTLYSRLTQFRYEESCRIQCSQNTILTHKQMIEICTLENISESSLEKIVGKSIKASITGLLGCFENVC